MEIDATGPGASVTVIGAGYLGLTHAVCLAELGHDVLAVDTDARKVAQAAAGTAPFFEPGLEELLRKQLDAGRLRFTTSHAEAARFADIHFLCVGTPQAPDGSATCRRSTRRRMPWHRTWRARALSPGNPRSRWAPRGRWRRGSRRRRRRSQAEVIWNPEFLREGSAVAGQPDAGPHRPGRLVAAGG